MTRPQVPRLWVGIETRTGLRIGFAEVATLEEASRAVAAQEEAWDAWVEAGMPQGAPPAVVRWEGSEVIAQEVAMAEERWQRGLCAVEVRAPPLRCRPPPLRCPGPALSSGGGR